MQLGSDQLTFVAVASQTADAYSLVDVTTPPGGGGGPVHRHDFQETFYLLDGTLTLFRGKADGTIERIDGVPGTALHVGPRVPHTFVNSSSRPARFIVVFNPGAPFENFARESSELAKAGPPDMAKALENAKRHGIEIMGPPPG